MRAGRRTGRGGGVEKRGEEKEEESSWAKGRGETTATLTQTNTHALLVNAHFAECTEQAMAEEERKRWTEEGGAEDEGGGRVPRRQEQ